MPKRKFNRGRNEEPNPDAGTTTDSHQEDAMPKRDKEPGQEEYDAYVKDVAEVLDLEGGLEAIMKRQDEKPKED
jgi:hypothetical protein